MVQSHETSRSFSGTVSCIVIIAMVFAGQSFLSCQDKGSDPEPTPTTTSTPTITPTPTPTGNAPFLIFPVDDEHLSGDSVTFQWTEPPGSKEFWLTLSVWYPPGDNGQWISLWMGFYQWTDEPQLTLSRSDIWFFYGEEDMGWVPSRYSWAVTSDTSTIWSLDGFFYWDQ